jgi:adenylate cyclase
MQESALKIARTAPAALPDRSYFANNGPLMDLTHKHEAWLEREGEQYPLAGNCSIGRAALNTLVLDSPKVSRLHSIIHLEDTGAFWLIDLASSNGTFLNKRRIHEPVRLHDNDQIAIGGHVFTFHQPRGKSSAELKGASPLLTLQEVESIDCWLLVADIKNFTPLSRSMVSDQLATLVSCWLATCKQIIERHRGAVNKYLGDGILAYWRDESGAADHIAAVIAALKEAQIGDRPQFRFVVHFGPVAIGGVASTREETLMGSEVNLVFRLEKLLASLDEPCGISDAAHAKIGESVPARFLGDHELKGFEKKRALFAV